MAAGLEQLDAYGALDDLPFSLDDPNWDLLFPALIEDQCRPFSLEDLDAWGTIENLPYSLDDPFWEQIRCDKFGQAVAFNTAMVTANANASFAANASISANALIDAIAIRTRTGAGDVAANAAVSATGSAIFAASAAINGTAQVQVEAIRTRTSSGAINAYAEVSAYATAVWVGAGAVNASANVGASGIRVRLASGNIDGSATVSADSLRIRTSTADIQATAQVTALGGVVFSGQADVLAVANLTCVANAIFSGFGAVSAIASVTADGTRLGENWNSAPGGGGEFTPVPPPFNQWGSVAPAIGEPFQGGFYAGEYVLGSSTFFLIVGDKSYEERASGVSGALFGVQDYRLFVSENNGLQNTNWIAFPTLNQSQPNFDSFYYKIRQRNISGTTDWYYPSKNEMELIIRNLYPTTTTASRFKTGGSQALGTSNPAGYWTSSIRSIFSWPENTRLWFLWASDTRVRGGMYSPPYGSSNQESLFYFRPVRRVRK